MFESVCDIDMNRITWFVALNLLRSGNSGRICSGDGGRDKVFLPENYSIAEQPSRPQAVYLGFSIKQIMDISDVKNVR